MTVVVVAVTAWAIVRLRRQVEVSRRRVRLGDGRIVLGLDLVSFPYGLRVPIVGADKVIGK